MDSRTCNVPREQPQNADQYYKYAILASWYDAFDPLRHIVVAGSEIRICRTCDELQIVLMI